MEQLPAPTRACPGSRKPAVPDLSILLAFTLASLVLAVVPGPNVTLIIATSLSRGIAAGLAVVAGTHVGVLSMVLVVAAGFDTLVGFMGWAFDIIKLVGALYLIWLGVQMFRVSGGPEANGPRQSGSLRSLAVRGFLVMWSNPKTLLFFGAFIPQFVTDQSDAFFQTLLFGLIFFIVAAITDTIYALMAGMAGKTFSRHRVRLISRISGSLIVAGGLWLATQQKA